MRRLLASGALAAFALLVVAPMSAAASHPSTAAGSMRWGATARTTLDGVRIHRATGVRLEQGPFIISASSEGNGSVVPAGDVTVNAGANQTFDFVPDPGYYVSTVMVDGSPVSLGQSYTFTNVQANHTIDVQFSPPTDACEFASSVVDYSSQYSATVWSARQALGPPDTYPQYGDLSTAWASSAPDGQSEHLVLGFDGPTAINFVNVYETLNPGALTTVSVLDPNTGLFDVVWTATPTVATPASQIATAVFPTTAFAVSQVRLDFDSAAVPGWNEVDAVSIGWFDPSTTSQFAASVVGFSSERSATAGSAQQALGPPNVYPGYSDAPAAWASLTPDGQPESLTLGYSTPVPINHVDVYETDNPGALDTVSVRNPATGQFDVVWTGTAAPAPQVARIFTASFPETRYLVSQVRLHFDSQAVPGPNEVDAVGIGRCACLPSLVDVPAAADLPYPHPSVYPNPVRGRAMLRLSLAKPGRLRVELYDVLGRAVRVLADESGAAAGTHEFTIQREGGAKLDPGIYFYRADVAGTVSGGRFVILR